MRFCRIFLHNYALHRCLCSIYSKKEGPGLPEPSCGNTVYSDYKNTQYIQYGTDQDNGKETDGKIFHYEIENLSALEFRCNHNLSRKLIELDLTQYQDSGRHRRDRHHDAVRQEIEEIEEIHAENCHIG